MFPCSLGRLIRSSSPSTAKHGTEETADTKTVSPEIVAVADSQQHPRPDQDAVHRSFVPVRVLSNKPGLAELGSVGR